MSDLLSICQDVAYEVGFNAPTFVISNTDPIAVQLLRLATREGKELANAHAWNRLITEDTITLVTSDQDYALPTDFNYILPATTYNRDDVRPVTNPINSQEWQFLKAWTTTTALNMRARIRANQMEFENTITSAENGETIAYEYVSTYWVVATGGTVGTKTDFTVDTDETIYDPELMIQGIVWRFKKAKGIDDWQVDFQSYMDLKTRTIARDGGLRNLDMGKSNDEFRIYQNIPEGNINL